MSTQRTLEAVLTDLEAQVDEFAMLLAAPTEALWAKPSEGEWSAAMCVVHMSDAEVHVSARLRWLLTEDNPAFPAWEEEPHMELSHDRSPEIAFAVIAAGRASNADLLRRVSPALLERTGVRPDDSVVNAVALLEGHLDHTTAHLAQARAALGQ